MLRVRAVEGDGHKNGLGEAKVMLGADGPATVAGVNGFWTANGGCDKATIGSAFAKELVEARVKIHSHEKWRDTKLADGTVKPLISGYCVADIVLRTKAGKVLLPQTHIDVLQGPEDGNLLYIAQVEEKRLGLKSFRSQIESLADKIKDGKRNHPEAPKQSKQNTEPLTTAMKVDGEVKRVRFEVGQQPVYKRRLQMGRTEDLCGLQPGKIKADGFAFAVERTGRPCKKTRT